MFTMLETIEQRNNINWITFSSNGMFLLFIYLDYTYFFVLLLKNISIQTVHLGCLEKKYVGWRWNMTLEYYLFCMNICIFYQLELKFEFLMKYFNKRFHYFNQFFNLNFKFYFSYFLLNTSSPMSYFFNCYFKWDVT